MDQGVIRSLKSQYHKNAIRNIIRSAEKKKTFRIIFLLQGMQMLVAAWADKNCCELFWKVYNIG